MNETLKVLETRRSCRNFDKEKMVSDEDLQSILKAGTYAAIGYAAGPVNEPAPRKENFVYCIK